MYLYPAGKNYFNLDASPRYDPIEPVLPEGAKVEIINGVQIIHMPSAPHPNPRDLTGHFEPAIPYKTIEERV